MQSDLRAGVIGAGYVSLFHLRALKRLNNVKTQAICDINGDVVRKVAQEWRIPAYYTDVNDMIESEGLDFVTICTPPSTHLPISVKAIESGIHALIEKPFTETEKEARVILNAAKATKGTVKVGVVHNLLFSMVVRSGRRAFQDIGRLLNFMIINTARFNDDPFISNERHWCHRMPGGRYSEGVPHFIYLAQEFMNDVKVRDIQARKLSNAPWVSFDEVNLILESDVSTGSVYWSRNTNKNEYQIHLFGTEGTLRIDISSGTIVKTRGLQASKKVRRYFEKPLGTVSEIWQMMATGIPHYIQMMARLLGYRNRPHDICIHSFVESLLNNQEPYVNAQKGYDCTRIAEEISTRLENMRSPTYSIPVK